MAEPTILALDSHQPGQWSTSVSQTPETEDPVNSNSAVSDLDEMRRQKRAAAIAKTKKVEAELRELLAAKNINLPVRIRMADPGQDVASEPADAIQDVGNGVYLVQSAGETRWHKIQKTPDMWTCSCAKWRRQRKIDCQHINKVRSDLEGRRIPYSTARRRPATRILFPKGTPCEATRRKKAYIATPSRCRELFEELCLQIPETATVSPLGGAPAIGLRARTYIFLMKVQGRYTYTGLSDYLTTDNAVQRLGWLKGTPISPSTLSAICADERLTDVFKKMIYTTARTAHRIETTAIIDASGLPNSLAGNHNEEKFGKRRKRKGRVYLKPHWVTGCITNLIPFVEFTLDYGLGSGDAPHYRRAARETKRVWPELKEMLGDGSYGPKGNFDASTALGIQLITREKRHEKRSEWGGQAAEIAELQHDYVAEFKERYRFRSRGETPPARIKGHQSYQRLRRRVNDVILPKDATEEDRRLCLLPDEELDKILDHACNAVGRAQANEAYAQIVAGNVREIVMLEHLHDEKVSLAAGSTFTPIPTLREEDLRAS